MMTMMMMMRTMMMRQEQVKMGYAYLVDRLLLEHFN
ncbi:unnamed protein product [Protopolystoma xenopodis]|uniref:Uncharacterized protein n=1 Tax=Protopolystoma xenopodis TaxID=117903 RepID=A0A448WUB7_9PLAT|nr:unnamed protein product [Protopolystoma xenopodis]